jgi:uncharacterized protein YdeI (YjbR/CyaY-like superfamily)
MTSPRFFRTPTAFRAWLDANHARATELLVGFHRKDSGRESGYRRLATHYVVSAKRPETRAKRLAALIMHSARGERIPQYVSTPKRA